MASGYVVQYGAGHDHLVARVEHRRERLVDRLLAAVGDHDLGGRHVVPAVAPRLLGDRLLELGQAAGGRVAVVLGVAAGRRPPPRRRSRGSGSRARRRRSRSPGRPSALSALAFASTLSVADSAIAPIRPETRRVRGLLLAGLAHGSIVGVAPDAGRVGDHAARGRHRTGLDSPSVLPVDSAPGGSPTCFAMPSTRAARRAGGSKGTSSTGRASVSKTEGWGFKSLVPCKEAAPDRVRPPGRPQTTRKRWPTWREATRCGRVTTGVPSAPARSCSTGRSSPSCARSSGRRSEQLITYFFVVMVFVDLHDGAGLGARPGHRQGRLLALQRPVVTSYPADPQS